MTVFIDPLDQILMDFYLACWRANEEGKTEIVNYSEWSKKIRKLMEYEKHRDEKFESFIGGTYPPTKKDELFPFEEESKEDIDKEIDEIIGNIQED